MLSGFLVLILASYLITHLINTVATKAARLITELRFCSPADIQRRRRSHALGFKYVHGSTGAVTNVIISPQPITGQQTFWEKSVLDSKIPLLSKTQRLT